MNIDVEDYFDEGHAAASWEESQGGQDHQSHPSKERLFGDLSPERSGSRLLSIPAPASGPAFAQQRVDKFAAAAVFVSMVIHAIMPDETRSLASRLIRAFQEPVHGRDFTSDVMIALVVCGIFFSLAALLFVTRTLLGDNEETREIKARLRFYQVEPRQFSNQCLMELVEVATRDLRSSEYPMNREVHTAIDRAAIEVRNILSGHKYYTSEEIALDAARGSANPYWQKLAFFDPPRFSLDCLAQTQARYGGRAWD